MNILDKRDSHCVGTRIVYIQCVAAAKWISDDAAVAAVSSEQDGIFTLKEQRTALKAFLSRKDVFVLFLTGLGMSLVKHRGASCLSMRQPRFSLNSKR